LAHYDDVKEVIADETSGLTLLLHCASDFQLDEQSIQLPALNTIWTVSFYKPAQQQIRENHGFMCHLRFLLKSLGTEAQRIATGVLWNVEEKDEFPVRYQKMSNIKSRKCEQYDLMISYSHENKDLCQRIYARLSSESNYSVWIDVENMHGSTLEAMAEAIEQTHIVLVCMSKAYRHSRACQAEGEYAYTRQRHIIPLKMQSKYNPDGWLGLLVGAKMYIDFTKHDFDLAYVKLLKEIESYQSSNRKTCISDFSDQKEIGRHLAAPFLPLIESKLLSSCSFAFETISFYSS
jgi:hypothetical protein